MRKMIIFVIVLVLTMLSVAIQVHASPSTDVSGTFSATRVLLGTPEANGNNEFVTYTGVSTWTGGISCPKGAGNGVQEWIIHFDGLAGTIPAPQVLFVNLKVESVLTSATVAGETGNLELQIIGKSYPDGSSEGTWKITSGTNGLANIHGQGTWMRQAGAISSSYEGQMHFDPWY